MSTSLTVSGTGVADNALTLYDGGTQVCPATVAANCTWSLKVTLNSGSHSLTATQTLTAGVTSAVSSAWSVTVPSH